MKINWKERFKNKFFVASMAGLVISFVYNILDCFEIVPSVSQSFILSIADLAIKALCALGILTDPTTEGFNDSARALTYGTENDVRRIDENEEEENDA